MYIKQELRYIIIVEFLMNFFLCKIRLESRIIFSDRPCVHLLWYYAAQPLAMGKERRL